MLFGNSSCLDSNLDDKRAMIRTNTVLEIKRGERAYTLHLPAEAPLGELHDVLHEMKIIIVKTIAERAQQEVVEPQEPVKQEE